MDEQQMKKYRQMTETPVGPLILRLALPCIVSMLVTAFYNTADTFFVGMLKSNAATGAVGVVFALMVSFSVRAAATSSPAPSDIRTTRKPRKWPPRDFSARWPPAC